MFWFNRADPDTLFIDNRAAEKGHIGYKGWENHEVKPDIIMDFRDLKFPDNSFKLVVFDPPHLHTAGPKSYMRKKYGILNKETWKDDISKGFNECWRVLDYNGTLIFKWNETQIPLKEVMGCFKESPRFGHTTSMHGKTIWLVFFKS